MKSKGVIYARESSDDLNKAPPIAEQIIKGKQYCKENDIELTEIYQDNGFSGGDWNRPGWKHLVNDAKFHKFNLVIVFGQDRIARDTEQFLWFNRMMKESFVKVFSLSSNEFINLDRVGDRVKFQSLAQADEIFRLVTSEKVRRTYEMKKRKAEKENIKFEWGRKAGSYDIEKIKELRSRGLGFREISKQVGGCSYQTIRRLLQNTLKENSTILKEEPEDKTQVTK